MLSLYVLSLSVAAAFVGSFVRGVLAQFGFIPGLMPAVYVTLGTALLYTGVQLLYLTLLRIYQPTRGRATFATEACSNLAALFLLPALLGISIPGASDSFQRAAPLIYFAAFGAAHLFFKLASFYAALSSPEDPERPILAWGLSGLAAGLAGALLVLAWRNSVEAGRLTVSDTERRVLAGTQYARARLAPEGATLSGTITAGDNPTLSLRFARAEARPQDGPSLDRLYVSVALSGRETKLYQGSVTLQTGGWAELAVPSEFFPPDLREYSVYWTRTREPNWQRILGLRPVVYNLPTTPGGPAASPARVYVSGPSVYSARPASRSPNLLVVLVDGLGADHLSLFGYPRDVSPAIDRLGYRAQLFPDTISTGANAEIALFAAMTGEDPAQLGGPGAGPALPELLRRAGYATVGFVESSASEILREAPWAAGFDLYDDIRPAAPVAPAEKEGDAAPPASTAIVRARAWIADHQLIPFFCLVRVRALAEFPPSENGSGDTFVSEGGEKLDVDRFDNALLGVDRQLGALFKFIRDYETRSNTYIVVTAPYGHEFSPGASRKFLGVPSERVPLIIDIPDRRQRKVPKRAHLQDLGATLASLAGVRLPSTADGKNLVP